MTIETIYITHDPFTEETYLGDGLYASFNGDMVRLRAPRFDGDYEVFLDQGVLRSFLDFIKSNGLPR